MSETPKKNTIGQGSKLLVDIGPAAVFMITYNIAGRVMEDGAIYWATGVFMATAALTIHRFIVTVLRLAYHVRAAASRGPRPHKAKARQNGRHPPDVRQSVVTSSIEAARMADTAEQGRSRHP